MKYFFVSDQNGQTHIIAAHTEASAQRIAISSNVNVNCLYELTSETFKDEGFLISDTRNMSRNEALA